MQPSPLGQDKSPKYNYGPSISLSTSTIDHKFRTSTRIARRCKVYSRVQSQLKCVKQSIDRIFISQFNKQQLNLTPSTCKRLYKLLRSYTLSGSRLALETLAVMTRYQLIRSKIPETYWFIFGITSFDSKIQLGLLARAFERLGYDNLAQPLMCSLAEYDIRYRYTHPNEPVLMDSIRITDDEKIQLYKKEDSNAVEWLLNQASKGVKNAKINLGQIMFFGQEGIKRNLKRSYNYFKQALESSDKHDGDLEYSVAIMKYKGSGLGLKNSILKKVNLVINISQSRRPSTGVQ